MKLLYISPINIQLPKGESIHFLEIGKNLKNFGNDLLVICRGKQEKFIKLNIRFIPDIQFSYLTTLLTELFLSLYLIFYLLIFKPDVVYYRGVALGGVISRIFRVPSVAEANGIYPDEIRMERPRFFRIVGPILKLRERVLYYSATRIICVTDGIRRELSKEYGVGRERCRVVPNGVNTRLFKPSDKMACRKELGFEEDSFCLGFVGTFQPWQGLDTLVEALRIVKERNNENMKCVLIGDGDEMEFLQKMVNQYGLHKEIIFKGRIRYKEVPKFINSFDVCVAPFKSQRNAKIGLSPLKIYEYMACAKPVITTRIEGVTEVIEKSNCGYLFEADDVNTFALRIVQCYNERDTLDKLGDNGRSFVERSFSWGIIAQKVEEILKEVTNVT
jgi:glycosyltransferase involved in cell wall biosynthesis